MAKHEYAFYPGCSSQKGASASNYLTSVESMCKTLDVKLTEIPDWNCCGASIGYAEAGELPRHVMNARNFALSEQHLPGQEIVATCAACWLGARETRERLTHSDTLMNDTREALKEAGLTINEMPSIRHMVEVLIEDLGDAAGYGNVAREAVNILAQPLDQCPGDVGWHRGNQSKPPGGEPRGQQRNRDNHRMTADNFTVLAHDRFIGQDFGTAHIEALAGCTVQVRQSNHILQEVIQTDRCGTGAHPARRDHQG